MRRALDWRGDAERAGEVPVGAVLVCAGFVVEAHNEKESLADPTAHAELLAIREAARRLGSWRLARATLYVTKEPCVMCAGAILAARIERLVYAANDPKGGADGGAFDILRSPGATHRLEIDTGVLQDEAAAQLREFFERKRGASAEGIKRTAP